jgi:protein-S-isoprenylcysteine O-methyltransferase Ste14
MQPFYHNAINVLWLIWCIYWFVAAASAKPTRRRESIGSRVYHIGLLVLGIALFSSSRIASPYLTARYLPRTDAFFWLGFILVALGLAIAIAARIWLGGNWSGTVTLKQNHELIRTGPYRFVRHPIYTGILLAILGSAIAQGELRGLVGLALIAAAFIYKIRVEETFLTEEFGPAYSRFRQEVPALVPLVRWPR